MSSNESARFFGKYTEIVYAVLLFLVIDLAVLALGFYTSFQIAADASSINLAGRQRMLSQRMTKALFNLKAEASQGGSVASDVAELTATVELFDGVLSAFRTGGEVRDSDNRLVWFNAIDTETGRVILNDAYAIWSPYRDSIRRLLANGQNPAEIDIAVNRARTTNLVLLDLMNRLTADIEEVASARAAQLRHVQLIGIGLALLNFVFILFKFIRRLREGDRLVDEAQRVTNEVKASADAAERLHQEDLRRFRAAVDLCVDAILLVDYAAMRYVDVNETACRMLGFTRAELLERGPQELAAPYRRGLKRDYDDLIESGEVRMAIGECRRKDGSLIPVEVSRRAQRSGDAWLVVVIMRDIRDRLAAERVIQDYLKQRELVAAFGQRTLANTDLTAVFNEAVQLIATTLHADACHVLEAHADKQGVTVRAAVGVIPYCVEQGAVQILPGSDLHQVLTSGEPVMIEVAEATPNNPLSPVSGLMAPVFEMQGIFGIIGVFTATHHRFTEDEIGFVQSVANILAPAIERNRAEQRLSYLAQFDTLTGLPNRHMLYDRLVQMLSVSRSAGGLIGCMFVDLDRFKDVNDTLGHSMGDLLLIQVSARLKQCLRNNDIVGRLGGDEFAVVLPNLARAEDAGAIAQKVIAELLAPFDIEGHRVHIAASVGIAIHPSDGDDADMLLKNADTAMYCVKAGGRNGYQFYALEMNERALQRIQMETQLRNALENEEFLLHYQPKAELAGGAICGFEALLRWRHPELGLMAPAEFIPLLESTGLIAPVGEWVLRTACEQIESWRRQGITPQPISVNVSARQFQKKDFADVVAQLLDETATDPAYIQLELTESLLMRDVDEVVRTLSKLKAMGLRISVDDFGTGHSSLAYLKRFPLDHLKIDQAFIRDSTTDPEDAEIALAIISLAHSLGLKVIAEGVENIAQLGFLQSHGCDEIQGFYFAKPLGAEECTKMLLEGRQLQMLAPSDQADVRSVLLVDDNQDDRELLQHALAPAGYKFFEADSPKAAFDVLAQHSVGIVISDHHMPGMTGVKFLASVRKLYPNAIRIALSGVTDAANVTNAVNEAGIHKYLSKDWDAMRIRAEVRHACLRREDVS